MNVINEIETLFQVNSFDDFTKLRYIYLFICEKFSYDTRFMYAPPSLKQEIYERDINIKSIQDFELTCYAYAKVLQQILDHFGYPSEIIKETDTRSNTPHAYVIVTLGNRKIKMDPTKKHDTTRVKMNANTYDFDTIIDDSTFEDDLNEADAYIRSLNVLNINEEGRKQYELMMDYIKSLEGLCIENSSSSTLFYNKFYALIALVNSRKDFIRYDDADYYFSYLLKRFKINIKGVRGNIVKPAVFFNKDDPTMKDMINIILIEFDDIQPFFYIMDKKNGSYRIDEIEPEEVAAKLEQYSNYLIDEYYKNAVKRATSQKGHMSI